MRVLAVWSLVALGGACGDEPRPRTEVRDPIVERRVEEARVELPAPPSSAWPEDVASLQDEIERFESIESCLAHLRAQTPTAVSEALADLSYDGFFDDVCRSLAALESRSSTACDAIEISAARRACHRRLAIVSGDPRACPADRVTPGREPTCVAWAARDPSLCRASGEPVPCRAVLANDLGACARLRLGDRARCEAHVRRYATVLGEERSAASEARTAMRLEVRESGHEALVIERSVLDSGARLVPRGCRFEVELANPLGEGGVVLREPTFRLALSLPGEGPRVLVLGASDAVLSVSTPRHGTMTSIAGARGDVTVERFEARLGGLLEGTIRGSLRAGGRTIAVQGRFATFVRDLDPLPDACGPR